MIKLLIFQEDTTILKAYSPNNRVPKYITKNLQNWRKRNKSTALAGGFNIPLSIIDRWRRKKIDKDTVDFKCYQNSILLIPKSDKGSTRTEN